MLKINKLHCPTVIKERQSNRYEEAGLTEQEQNDYDSKPVYLIAIVHGM